MEGGLGRSWHVKRRGGSSGMARGVGGTHPVTLTRARRAQRHVGGACCVGDGEGRAWVGGGGGGVRLGDLARWAASVTSLRFKHIIFTLIVAVNL
jgi:hypothetical protein